MSQVSTAKSLDLSLDCDYRLELAELVQDPLEVAEHYIEDVMKSFHGLIRAKKGGGTWGHKNINFWMQKLGNTRGGGIYN